MGWRGWSMAIRVSVLAGCGSKGVASDGGTPSTGSGGVVGGGGSGGAARGAGAAFGAAAAPVGERAGLPRSLRSEHGPDLLPRHRRERMGQRDERVQPGGDADGVGERLRGPPSGRLPHGERDGQQRDAEAARPVVVGADGDAGRQPRQDSVRHLVSPERPQRKVPRDREAGVRHAPQRLDVHARPVGPRLVAAGRDRRRLRGQRPRGDQRQLLRDVRRRGEHQQARHRRVLPQ